MGKLERTIRDKAVAELRKRLTMARRNAYNTLTMEGVRWGADNCIRGTQTPFGVALDQLFDPSPEMEQLAGDDAVVAFLKTQDDIAAAAPAWTPNATQ